LLKQTIQTTDRKKLNETRAGYLKQESVKSQKIDQLRDLNRDISTSAFFYENKINEI